MNAGLRVVSKERTAVNASVAEVSGHAPSGAYEIKGELSSTGKFSVYMFIGTKFTSPLSSKEAIEAKERNKRRKY